MKPENALTAGQLDNSFLEVEMYKGRPLRPRLSGLGLEYTVVQIFTRASGKKEAKIGFNVGQGSQDIGFRNTIDILFDVKPAVKVVFDIKDEDNKATMASLLITDGVGRLSNSESETYFPDDIGLHGQWQGIGRNLIKKGADAKTSDEKKLLGSFYPLPSRRLASRDPFPDFFFQPQVYRADGEYVYLPPGKYHVTFGKGPEYKTQQREITVTEQVDSMNVAIKLERWIHMAKLGWYSADHHIHAAGCAHYESPEEGVLPEHMWRQVVGEDLNLGSNLTWGPSWYYQKQFFTGKDHPLSDKTNLLRYDVEVSGFPSSHAGHIVLLNLKEDDYTNTTTVEQWPTWTLPVSSVGKSSRWSYWLCAFRMGACSC